MVKTPMVAGGKELTVEMIRPGPPVLARECVKGPPLGQPVNRRRTMRVNAPLVHLARLPEIQHQAAPRTNAVVVQGFQRTP